MLGSASRDTRHEHGPATLQVHRQHFGVLAPMQAVSSQKKSDSGVVAWGPAMYRHQGKRPQRICYCSQGGI